MIVEFYRNVLEKYYPPLAALPAETKCRRGMNFEPNTYSGLKAGLYATLILTSAG